MTETVLAYILSHNLFGPGEKDFTLDDTLEPLFGLQMRQHVGPSSDFAIHWHSFNDEWYSLNVELGHVNGLGLPHGGSSLITVHQVVHQRHLQAGSGIRNHSKDSQVVKQEHDAHTSECPGLPPAAPPAQAPPTDVVPISFRDSASLCGHHEDPPDTSCYQM